MFDSDPFQDATVSAASTTKDVSVKAASNTTTAVSSSFANVVFLAKKVMIIHSVLIIGDTSRVAISYIQNRLLIR